jgi:hypothetical protein
MAGKHLAELERKRSTLQTRIRGMVEELRAIESQISEIKADEFFSDGRIQINNKNRKKILILSFVRQYLLDFHEKHRGQGLTTKELYDRVSISSGNLKYSSFRSYLHRFEREGLLYKAEHGGRWRLTKSKEGSSTHGG